VTVTLDPADVIDAASIPSGCAAFLDGDYRVGPSEGETIYVEDPAMATVVAQMREADDDLVDRAVRASQSAFRGEWGRLRGFQRGQVMQRCAAVLRNHADQIARLESLDTGKPLSQARGDVEISARYFEFYAGSADKLHGETIPTRSDEIVYTVREPYGVVAHITPWNSPLSQMCRGVAPSLACGNTVVVKPSEVTPLSTLYAVRLLTEKAGLPVNTITVVVGRGPTTGAAIARHPGVEHIAFTGSVPTGTAIMTMAAQRMVGCNLELGGKSPTIVLPDADLDKAARAGAAATIRNSGQSCFATTRMIVHDAVYDEFVERCVSNMQQLSLGHGLTDPDLGPLSSAAQLERVRTMVDRALSDGARLAAGGADAELDLDRRLTDGHFFAPTLLADVDNASFIAQNEVFGPVQTVIRFSTIDEAVALANDSRYGLAAGVFTRDLSAAHTLASRLEAGQVQVNRYPAGDVQTPFGGYKSSGIGREKGTEALHHYSQLKTVIIDLPAPQLDGSS
jgi:aldehyde dehydrogenase (NAD+)